MLKIPKRYSLRLSLVISAVFFALCILGAIFLPHITNTLISLKERFPEGGASAVLALAYAILTVAAAADVLVFVLLLRVRKRLVFTDKSIALLRGISWCCILLGALFGVLGYYFLVSFTLAFAAVFLGICLRVVKNVLEEGAEIKSENDLTV